MTIKHVEMIATPSEPHYVGDGFRVHNFIPSYHRMDMKRMDPFLMLDYNSKFVFPPSEEPRGVDVHPHRGFETVTIAYKGRIEHHDSSGGGGIIGEGGVQWMTAASGVLHKEFHERAWSKQGGVFQMVQLWVNLPAKYKMSAPKYQALEGGTMPRVSLNDGPGHVEVIAGKYRGQEGAASTFSPIHLYNARLQAGDSADFEFPAHYNTALLVIEGSIEINGTEHAQTDQMALFYNDGETFSIRAKGDTVVLILSGEPLNEPIAAHGPFVMNTRQELITAFTDYNEGKFGYLE